MATTKTTSKQQHGDTHNGNEDSCKGNGNGDTIDHVLCAMAKRRNIEF
jgi:hypothetical protein